MTRNVRDRWRAVVRACLILGSFPGSLGAASKMMTLEVRDFPLQGQTQNLEPQVLDFRYAPYRWQTCIGLPDDPHKSIVGSDGGLYYDYGGGPYYDFKTRVLASLDAEGLRGKIRQSLLDPRIPVVTTAQDAGPLTLSQQAWAGAVESTEVQDWSAKRVDYLWLKLKNNGPQEAAGRIVVHVDSKDQLALNEDRSRLVHRDDPGRTFCVMSPACASVEYAAAGSADNRSRKSNSLTLLFEKEHLAAQEEYRVLVTIYQGSRASIQPAEQDAALLQRQAVEWWKKVTLPYDRMNVPDKQVQGLLDGCIRNIYQAREIKNGRPAFQVGPTCYRGTWAADGPFILEAVTYLGRASEARAGLEHQVDEDQGPGGVEFSKKSGLRLWMIGRHAQLTADRAWLEKMWPRVQREVSQIVEYRRMTMSDPNQANYGLMPIGFGDGGLGGKHREYTNVYWTLAGLKAAVEMAKELNKPELPDWRQQYIDYWAAFSRARDRDKLVDHAGNVYVPVTMKGEAGQLPQRGAWAFLQSVFPGRIFEPDDKLMLGTMAMLDATQREGLIYGTGWLPDGIWNYAASFYGHAHLWLGHGRKAASVFYAFGNHASPLLCWREEQNLVGEKEKYCGDMPHNWASAEFIRMVRHMLILEQGSELHLLAGLPSNWTTPGGRTQMTGIPTSFGPVSLSLDVAGDGKSALIEILPPEREILERIVVHLEHFGRPVRTVEMDGRQWGGSAVEIPASRTCRLKVHFVENL